MTEILDIINIVLPVFIFGFGSMEGL